MKSTFSGTLYIGLYFKNIADYFALAYLISVHWKADLGQNKIQL